VASRLTASSASAAVFLELHGLQSPPLRIPPGRAGVFHTAHLLFEALAPLSAAHDRMAKATWFQNATTRTVAEVGRAGPDATSQKAGGDVAQSTIAAEEARPPTMLLETVAGGAQMPPGASGKGPAVADPCAAMQGATSQTLADTLIHPLTTTLFTHVCPRLAAAVVDGMRVMAFAGAEQAVAQDTATVLSAALAPSLRGALQTTLPPAISRTLPAALLQAVEPLLTDSLTRSVTHATTMTLVASLLHARMGRTSPACAHCLATAGGSLAPGVEADGGVGCDQVCWGGPAVHAAVAAAVDAAHSASAFFVDYYLNATAPARRLHGSQWWNVTRNHAKPAATPPTRSP